MFFIFTPICGEMIQFDEHVFSKGLKPPTRCIYLHLVDFYHQVNYSRHFFQTSLPMDQRSTRDTLHPILPGIRYHHDQSEDAKSQERFIQVGQSAWAIDLACYRVSLR